MATMRLMTGPSGAGKTTYAKLLAAKYPHARYLCIDDFYKTYHGGKEIHEHEFEVWIQFFQAIHAAEQESVDVIIDTNAPSKVDRIQFKKWFKFEKYRLYVVQADWITCTDNNHRRTRQIPTEELWDMYDKYRAPESDEWMSWDTITWVQNDGHQFTEKGAEPYLVV